METNGFRMPELRPVTVTARAFGSVYHAWDRADCVMSEYHIEVRFNNPGLEPCTFDTVRAVFIPAKGTPLICTSRPKAAGSGEWAHFAVEAGGTLSHVFETNGYTSSLLNDTQYKPLMFRIEVEARETLIAGPYAGHLPTLTDLPRFEKGATPFEAGTPLRLHHVTPAA
ncbi:MAG: hypothetical protein HYU66_11195 [Armatimonadetes bacterium]|nr:hypothetical protein [Armatimonadota bacterium]